VPCPALPRAGEGSGAPKNFFLGRRGGEKRGEGEGEDEPARTEECEVSSYVEGE